VRGRSRWDGLQKEQRREREKGVGEKEDFASLFPTHVKKRAGGGRSGVEAVPALKPEKKKGEGGVGGGDRWEGGAVPTCAGERRFSYFWELEIEGWS